MTKRLSTWLPSIMERLRCRTFFDAHLHRIHGSCGQSRMHQTGQRLCSSSLRFTKCINGLVPFFAIRTTRLSPKNQSGFFEQEDRTTHDMKLLSHCVASDKICGEPSEHHRHQHGREINVLSLPITRSRNLLTVLLIMICHYHYYFPTKTLGFGTGMGQN